MGSGLFNIIGALFGVFLRNWQGHKTRETTTVFVVLSQAEYLPIGV